ncbi:phage tail terminator protein [Oceanobacter mangrovi]|uniref:phage tail terminator protein n=1 Tax=Oceanobacter mangrovi TaxID=2862510 RepID=UPI001C8E3598|nr:hypothetical protein [Oceanobacter mangrovi]
MLSAVQAEIVARLEQLLPKTVRVLTTDDLMGVREDEMPTPCVHVIYQGGKVQESRRPDHRVARLADSWLIVVVVSAERRGDSTEAIETATEHVDVIRPGLMGWRPPSANGPMELATPPAPAKTSACFYLPVAFIVETIVHANR